MTATSSPLPAPRCSRHRNYYLAYCEGCRAAQAVRIQEIRAARLPAPLTA